ncbi:MAG: glycosyl hydrolase 53 family protein [Treponema sp.]|jgi:arabinogalactan endo-1,4-beta-galactosidase|nr:glycosyl hydrolase 53 family protein [Treponema sp.]
MMETGMDVSTLEETERLGGKFYEDGKEAPLFDILKRHGVTSIRLRLWNDPFNERGENYGAGGCDIETVLRTARRAVENGMNWILDFHYSDFWADPAKQFIPKAWKGFSPEQLEKAVYEYTKGILARCKNEALYPGYVQIGNEITNGMLWPVGKAEYNKVTGNPISYDNMIKLLKAGVAAARESGNVKIIFHLEKSCDNARYRQWFDAVTAAGADYDIIGVSYYPHWHGTMLELKRNLEDISERYNKDVMVVETAYPFTNEHYAGISQISLVISDRITLPDGNPPPYPHSAEGQSRFLRDLVKMVKSVKRCIGLYYWEPGWLAMDGSTWATESARKYIGEEHKTGGNEWANQCLFDYKGNLLPAVNELDELRGVHIKEERVR